MVDLVARLATGKPLVMPHLVFNTGNLVEFLGTLGFESVLLDCEHTAASVERIDALCRAARAAGIGAIVRPERLDGPTITRYLDCRADGIMVPMVQNAADAQRLVDIVRYARPDTAGRILKIAMLESGAAIENLDSILDIAGIDAFFVARNDLSKSLGFGDSKSHPEVRRIVDATIGRIRARGRVAGAGGDMANVAEVIGTGAQLILASLRELLKAGADRYLAQV